MTGQSSNKHIIGLHRPPGVERQPDDFYATHSSAIPPLLKLLGWEHGGKLIWENSCGQGHLSRPLIEAGHTVISTDLIDRGFGIPGVDFLRPSLLDGVPFDAIIMNPPYKLDLEFVEKSLRIAPVVCAFFPLRWLASVKRADLYENTPPSMVAVNIKRVPCSKNGLFGKNESSTVDTAWFIWERGFTGDPVVKRI